MAQNKATAKFRSPIYDYLKKQGLDITPAMHEELKQLLIEYVDGQTGVYKEQIKQLENHMATCQRLARRKRNNGKKTVG